ncbi:YncE family protein [Weeksella virosa]|uniref:Quinoprotein amine dehydrogenase n=1 Tax=Weeksella virosa (strain ATCC 43766 / DSM 16922 / JCM 21250 / CCUG 30538 / CDC 9751 / IAM 14551 / NBRC 16016 / NCTC 11634 / CL345/78) TaxID=865938 RepID=F0P1W9_WEEVC|nr:DUF5074 domain-containing protein [Weeksella virosa]ADX67679.1 quinoprotein amine dehydrogenase [Weeksella virosa DSM 16922]MDK7674225.1 hypothetical protein [Weeksella virosa]VEH64696.1 PQQ-dependent catabolism-associated beta-propeller protein [Weeksella virosa]
MVQLKKQSYPYLFAAVALLFTACNNDDDHTISEPEEVGTYAKGFFILNEGNSSPTSSSISFLKNGTMKTDIFRKENPNSPEIGTYLQSMFFDKKYAYIISSNSNSVTVVDKNTFKYVKTYNENLDTPRYGLVHNGKAYITNQGAWNLKDDFVTVIDLSSGKSEKIMANDYTELITEENNKIYISNGYYSEGTTVMVLNPQNNQFEKKIDLGENNSPIAWEEENNSLYILTSGKRLLKMNLVNHQIQTQDLPSDISMVGHLKIEDDFLYYTSANKVYKQKLDSKLSETPLFSYESSSQYGVMYGFTVDDNRIYISDATDFNSDGRVLEYSTNGSFIKEYKTGIAPNGFYKND